MMQTQGLQQLDVRHMLPLTTADQTLKQITKKKKKKPVKKTPFTLLALCAA